MQGVGFKERAPPSSPLLLEHLSLAEGSHCCHPCWVEGRISVLSISQEVCEAQRTLHPNPMFRIRILYLALRHLPETCVFFYLLGNHSRDSSQNSPRPPSPKVDSLQPFFQSAVLRSPVLRGRRRLGTGWRGPGEPPDPLLCGLT